MHIYAFKMLAGSDIPAYDRSFGEGRLAEWHADRWIEADPDRRFVTVGMVPFKFWY